MTLSPHLHYQRTVFENGLTLLVSENHRLPLVAVQTFVLAGVDQNPEGRSGLASLTARLLDEGTERYSHEAIAEMLENAGTSLSLFSQREVSGLSMQFRTEELSRSIELLDQMIRYPTLEEERLDFERQKVMNHVRSLQDDPQTVAGQLLNLLVYDGTPLRFPVLGLAEDLPRITVDDVRNFHRQRFGPAATFVSVVGDVDGARIVDMIGQTLGRWEAPAFSPRVIPRPVRQNRPLVAERNMDKEQVQVLVGHLGVERRNPDHPALQLLDVILGSGPGFTSRIPRRLRDEQGLAYTTYSDISGSSGLYPGRFIAYISTSPENRDKALEGLLSEIRGVLRDGVTEEELEVAKRYLTGSFVFELQSNYLVSRFIFALEAFGLGSDYLQRYPEIISRITRDEVNHVARLYLDTVNYSTVIVGPAQSKAVLNEFARVTTESQGSAN